MTEKMREHYECDKFDWTDYTINKSQVCHQKTWDYYVANGDIPADAQGQRTYCLHHIDPTMKYFDILRYAEWRIEDVIPMTTSEHIKLHQDFQKRNEEYGFLGSLMMERVKWLNG